MFGLDGQQKRSHARPLLFVALAIWIPLAGLTAHAVSSARETVRSTELHHLEDVAQGIARAVDGRLSAAAGALASLAASETLRAPLDLAAFEREGRLVGRLLQGVLILTGPPPAFDLLASTSADPTLMAERVAAGWMREAIAMVPERPGLSDLFISPVQEHSVFALGVPVPAAGRPAQRLWLTLEPSVLQALLREIELPDGASATIRDGRLRSVAGTARGETPPDLLAPGWVLDGLGGQTAAVLTGADPSGAPLLVAVRRLAMEPRWLVMVAAPPAGLGAATLEALALPVASAVATLACFLAIAWAVRRERLLQTVSEAEMLRSARDEVARVHAGLPAVIFLREMTPNGQAGRLLYRAGDIGGVTGWPAAAMQDAFMGDASEAVDETREAMARFMRDGEITFDWRMRQPDGSWRWLRCQARTLDIQRDGTRIAVGYLTNITAEREAQAQAQAARRLASLADLAHGLAHELKQPLQVIALSAETAQLQLGRVTASPQLPDMLREPTTQIAEALEGIVHQAMRTGDVIEHLRRFSRGGAEGQPNVPVRLDVAVEGAMLLIGHALRRDRIELDIALGDPPPTVFGQTISIEQILVNLLNNARDALADRPIDAPRRIRIDAAVLPDGSAVTLTVADTAGGIPAKVMDRLFEPFVTTKGMEKGTGLGLSLCDGLAKGMGGSISARNGPEGAIFTLRLPLAMTTPRHGDTARAA